MFLSFGVYFIQPDKERQPEQTETSQTAKGFLSLVCRSGCVVFCKMIQNGFFFAFLFCGISTNYNQQRHDSTTENAALYRHCMIARRQNFSSPSLHAQETSSLQGFSFRHDFARADKDRAGRFSLTRSFNFWLRSLCRRGGQRTPSDVASILRTTSADLD